MPDSRGVFLVSLLVLVLTSGCVSTRNELVSAGLANVEQLTDVPGAASEIASVEIPTTSTPLPPSSPPYQSVEEGSGELEAEDWVISANARDYLGQVACVRVEVSHCAYMPYINGSPTFCNDQPFPEHDFTFLMWGVDLSHLDQSCVLVSGEIVEYDGKPQIVVESEEQIILCDN